MIPITVLIKMIPTNMEFCRNQPAVQNQQHQVQKIEECQRILQNDLLICPGVGVFVIIYLALRNSFLNFFVRKSCHASYLPVLSMAYGSVRLKLAHAPVMIVNKRINTPLLYLLHPRGYQTSVWKDPRS